MPSATLQSPLDANLTLLAAQNADLVELLREAESGSGETKIEFFDTEQGVLGGTIDGRQLCSRRRPLEEAARLADGADLVEHAVVVVLGFGLGYHVRRLAERMGTAGIIVVFEPDVALLRTVFERIDHSSWLGQATIVFLTDPGDRGALGTKLHNCEAILSQGVLFLEHPASKARLGDSAGRFSKLVTDHMTAAQVTMQTTLTRTVDTIRNLLSNLDHYAGEPGVKDLENAAKGFPAILVSAGPSLQKNIHLLAQPGMRDRCIIVAVQTVLKPMLAAGIKPHFVTALDYHELSKRFYEGLTAEDVDGVTLIAEPKVHPSVLDLFPGRSRCIASPLLDKLMGDLARDMGRLTAGSTVAHLSLYVALHLGCDPIAMIGQDLGFPDGLYYAPGNAVHDVWAPEFNPFNTMEMMEWQRIRRFHNHLHKTVDVQGKPIYTDAQMIAYLQQFERDFHNLKRSGITIIDATEGGVRKQHTLVMPLAEVLQKHATRELPPLPEYPPTSEADTKRLSEACARVAATRRDVAALRETSRKTANLLREMLTDQQDSNRMDRHFRKIERLKKQVEQRITAFELISNLNQVGMFKRVKADRRLTMSPNLSPLARQRAEIERDLENVKWIADAAEEMIDQLLEAERALGGDRQGSITKRRTSPKPKSGSVLRDSNSSNFRSRIAAMVPVDPKQNGLGIARDLSEDFFGRTVLQATIERLGRSRLLDEIILIAPQGFDIEALIEPAKVGGTVTIERCDGSPFGKEHRAVAAARLFADTCWRGGVSGMSIFDEVLAPQAMSEIMQRRGLTAALLVGPDWPLIDVTEDSGCDAIIARHLERPDTRSIVFTQAPPGLGACLLSASLMADLATRNRLASIGARLSYRPHLPQVDPIMKPANVQIDHRIRQSLIRATFDSPRYRSLLKEALNGTKLDELGTVAVVSRIEEYITSRAEPLPHHLIVELTPRRTSNGVFGTHPFGPLDREPMQVDLARRIFEQCSSDGCVVTFAGAGDPLLHPQFDECIRIARDCRVHGIHVRTDLRCDEAQLDRLLACGVDVVSVDLHADSAATYTTMHGKDELQAVFKNIEYFMGYRQLLTKNSPPAALGVPWLVPRLQRRTETYNDLEGFFERWQHVLGAAVIEGIPDFPETDECPADSLVKPRPPRRVVDRELKTRMMILSDGSVPVSELDLAGSDCVGNIADRDMGPLWRDLLDRRRAGRDSPNPPGVLRP